MSPHRTAPLDATQLQKDFPILSRPINGHPLVYLDNAASTQKPQCVIDTLSRVYREDYANVHRGVHTLSQRATEQYEGAREKVRAFLNARSTREIIFVRGTTEAINLVAQSYGRSRVGPGDEILVTALEHHSNLVPWQLLCASTGATLRWIPLRPNGELDLDSLDDLLTSRTRLLALSHMSNALGTLNPVQSIIQAAHARDIPVLLDGAQSAPHLSIDVTALDCDFFAFSGHKLYGPSGIGVLYGRESLLEAMPPYQGGGDMIRVVRLDHSEYNELPYKFEAGTPSIADAIALGRAIDYLNALGLDAIEAHESGLLTLATERLLEIPELTLIGTAKDKGAILSFTLSGIHPHDIGTLLDQQGIAIRAGHHCAMPVMDFFGVPATARASFGLYNTASDIEALAEGIRAVIRLFG